MKIDREYFESNNYKLQEISDKIAVYTDGDIEVFFETETLEKIGVIYESDVRCSRNKYYTAKTVTESGWKTLCTRGDHSTAWSLILEEYKTR